MAESFTEHLERGEQALDKFHNDEARAAFEAALDLAKLPHERALALDGLATILSRADENERSLELLDEAAALCLPDGETPAEGQTACVLAQVWHEKGIQLIAMRRDEEAITVFDQSLARFLDRAASVAPISTEWKMLRRTIARTLNAKGTVLHSLDRLQESLGCFEETISRFQNVDDIRIQKCVARAMRWRAWLFGHLGRQDKEVEGYDELFARFAQSTDRDISDIVVSGLENKTNIYRDQEDFETVIEVCDQIINRYRNESFWPIASAVARAMVRQAVAFGRRGAHNKELAAYDNVLRLYGDSPDPSLRVHAAKALMFKAVSLNDADEVSAEMECYDEVIRRYAGDADREVRVVAADALIHKGLSLGAIAEDAAEDTGEREIDAEIACYDEVLARFGAEEFIPLQRAVAEALLHKAEVLSDVGSTAEASQCLERLIASYDAIKDLEMQEIVTDAQALRSEL